jgi:hypothetical protein
MWQQQLHFQVIALVVCEEKCLLVDPKLLENILEVQPQDHL